MFFLISGGLILFALIAVAKGDNLKEPRAFAPVLLLRYCAEMIGLLCMIMGLTKVPLSIVGAVIFLKKAVSWRRWSSISIGFLGVVLVIQPWEESLNYAVIWPIVALIAFSIRDLVTRLTPPDIASASLATFTMVAALPFTTAWVFFTGEKFFPAEINWAIVSGMVILGSVGYLLLITSLRVGELSAIIPFRYSRIVFLLILGFVVFGERPSLSMLLGTALIIISGVYVMWREHIVTQRIKRS